MSKVLGVVVALVAIAGCNDDKAPAGASSAEVDALRVQLEAALARVTLLEQLVGNIPTPNETIAGRVNDLERDVKALQSSGGAKQPHLVVADTGKDLGLYLGDDRVYDQQLGAEVAVLFRSRIYFDSVNCTGTGWLNYDASHDSELLNGPAGSLLRLDPATTNRIYVKSYNEDGSRCTGESSPFWRDVVGFTDTGVPNRYFRSVELRVELR